MDDLTNQENAALDALAQKFIQALRDKDQGRFDDAEDALRDILQAEPRLAEPRMELARILLDSDRLKDAEDHAREALVQLEAGGQWVDNLPENTVLGLCHGLLAEVLRRRADDDDVIFGDPETFHTLVADSKKHFAKAAELDPSDDYSSYHAFFLGPEQGGAPVTPSIPLVTSEPGEA